MTDGTHVVPLEHRALVDEAVGRLLDRAAARCVSELSEPRSSEDAVTPA
jgi:hypothetical protein